MRCAAILSFALLPALAACAKQRAAAASVSSGANATVATNAPSATGNSTSSGRNATELSAIQHRFNNCPSIKGEQLVVADIDRNVLTCNFESSANANNPAQFKCTYSTRSGKLASGSDRKCKRSAIASSNTNGKRANANCFVVCPGVNGRNGKGPARIVSATASTSNHETGAKPLTRCNYVNTNKSALQCLFNAQTGRLINEKKRGCEGLKIGKSLNGARCFADDSL